MLHATGHIPKAIRSQESAQLCLILDGQLGQQMLRRSQIRTDFSKPSAQLCCWYRCCSVKIIPIPPLNDTDKSARVLFSNAGVGGTAGTATSSTPHQPRQHAITSRWGYRWYKHDERCIAVCSRFCAQSAVGSRIGNRHQCNVEDGVGCKCTRVVQRKRIIALESQASYPAATQCLL